MVQHQTNANDVEMLVWVYYYHMDQLKRCRLASLFENKRFCLAAKTKNNQVTRLYERATNTKNGDLQTDKKGHKLKFLF